MSLSCSNCPLSGVSGSRPRYYLSPFNTAHCPPRNLWERHRSDSSKHKFPEQTRLSGWLEVWSVGDKRFCGLMDQSLELFYGQTDRELYFVSSRFSDSEKFSSWTRSAFCSNVSEWTPAFHLLN
ncbi:hypothetical protein JTE90_010149 [Oedothorax gibbosus]|uniref:Uncharacterized protein n=1 Tax=Oedothorax gibbosus TaxID=931172 RepID=A0AAV6UIU8_9ARAC|nr:hypothetical protein JTE90_010149 [Oedothorax gibbosus]